MASAQPKLNAIPGAKWTLSRRECIVMYIKSDGLLRFVATTPFLISDNPKASSDEPWYEWHAMSEVNDHTAAIDTASAQTGVQADWIRAIMFMETTHGYYDGIPFGPNTAKSFVKSILPMNINVDYWGDLFGSRDDLSDPATNVMAGAKMLRALRDCLSSDSTFSKIATLYNNLNATTVSDYGARVDAILKKRLWAKPPR